MVVGLVNVWVTCKKWESMKRYKTGDKAVSDNAKHQARRVEKKKGAKEVERNWQNVSRWKSWKNCGRKREVDDSG